MTTSVKTHSRIPTTDRLAALRLQLVTTQMSLRVGQRIRQRREELGMNQRELADAVVDLDPEKNRAVTNQTVSNWERGVNEPGARYKEALAKAMTVDVGYFIAEPTKAPTPDLSRAGGVSESQLDRVERQIAELHRKLDRLTPLLPGIAELVGLDDETASGDPAPPASP
jgi:transcriptional regulator with XRE-family HTH domain